MHKVAESSTQLSCLSNVTASLSLFQNECPLKMLAVVASDLPKLSNKIAYPERTLVLKQRKTRCDIATPCKRMQTSRD